MNTTQQLNILRWRTVDIIVATVLGAVTGLIFLIWNGPGGAWYGAGDALTPGFGGLAGGIWLIGGILGGLIIRKPGAAIYVELIAAVISAVVGNTWGVSVIFSGLVQGLGAELVFAIFRYRRFGLVSAALAGACAAAFEWVAELWITPNISKDPAFLAIYFVCIVMSGIILAGVLGWVLVKAIAQTGVLNRFAAGHQNRARV